MFFDVVEVCLKVSGVLKAFFVCFALPLHHRIGVPDARMERARTHMRVERALSSMASQTSVTPHEGPEVGSEKRGHEDQGGDAVRGDPHDLSASWTSVGLRSFGLTSSIVRTIVERGDSEPSVASQKAAGGGGAK